MDSFLSTFTVLYFTISGDKTKKLPFTHSPENDIKIAYMEDIIENEEIYSDLYSDYSQAALNGVVTKRLEKFMKQMKENISPEALGKFIDNGEKYILLQTIVASLGRENIQEEYRKYIEEYLKFSRLGDKEANGFSLSPELKARQLIHKVERYIEKENIKVKEIIFPNECQAINDTIYPMKLTYRYILKGMMKEQPFEREAIQDFYIGFDWSKGVENGRDVIEYIQDSCDF